MHQDDCQSHQRAHFVQGSGRGPTRLIRLVRRVPPTTDGTTLKTAWSMISELLESLAATAWSLTSALLESLAATATDDGDSVGATSADDESGSAWSEDSDDI